MSRRHILIALTALMLLAAAFNASAQRLVNWTEGPGELGLGYPVPMPQDTPLPFAGFRSYAGLHTRHLDLTNTRDDFSRYILGQTFNGRDINMYVMSDLDSLTVDGRREGSVLLNGGIHAREWQSPEVSTGVMELLADQGDDNYFYQYLLENMNIAVIPVFNIDGFLQTQRFPDGNYLDTDPGNPAGSPRDGRMRRKNMRNVDEVLTTTDDHLLGIDLNRNNPPFWATTNSSSPNPNSLIYHGASASSEPETQALANAPAQMLPGSNNVSLGSRLRMYIDIHSFSADLRAVATNNTARNANQQSLMVAFVRHHQAIPGGRAYLIRPVPPANTGIGVTPDFFGNNFQVPAWTLELEPGFNAAGTEYGGFNSNGHSGFILPEAEVPRLRQGMASTMAAATYYQAGPPSIQRIRVIDADTDALVFESAQQTLTSPGQNRQQSLTQYQPLLTGRNYRAEIAFDKPMRWLSDNGEVVAFPGQFATTVPITLRLETPTAILTVPVEDSEWQLEAGYFGGGFRHYMTDVVSIPFSISDTPANDQLINGMVNASIAVTSTDMIGFGLDANPATPVDWQNGDWTQYEVEPAQGTIATTDRSVNVMVSNNGQADGYLIDSRVSGTWQSLSQDGIGYILEILPDGRVAVSWATFDEQRNQRWLIGVGEVLGNRIVVDHLSFSTGPAFGADFDTDDLMRQTDVGSLEFVFTDCDAGTVEFSAFGQSGRLDDLVPTTQIAGIGCKIDNVQLPPLTFVSGTWFNPTRNGEGFTLHVLPDGRVIMYWYTFNILGEQLWLIGVGEVIGENEIMFTNVRSSSGALFGNAFDPDDVSTTSWGVVGFELGCDTGTVSYGASNPSFGSGSFNLVKLTNIAGVNCPQ